jgi:hypothetical protein
VPDLSRLNSATKYPSIETYHAIDPKTGRLDASLNHTFTGRVVLTEKIDGTNGRVVVMPDGDWFIGSREELLYAKGDRIENPELGIVPALLRLARELGCTRAEGASARYDAASGELEYDESDVIVYFFEVYGHRIGGAGRQYTSSGATGFRLFDVAHVPGDVLSWEREKISSWRQHGGQRFSTETVLAYMPVPVVPRIATVNAAELPTGLEGMQRFLCEYLPASWAMLDENAGGKPEGIVLRSEDRSVIAKAKFKDYARTLGK